MVQGARCFDGLTEILDPCRCLVHRLHLCRYVKYISCLALQESWTALADIYILMALMYVYIVTEMANGRPLFAGTSESDQLDRIFRHLGTPTEAIYPGMVELPEFQKVKVRRRMFTIMREVSR